jgi:hypothetical protein
LPLNIFFFKWQRLPLRFLFAVKLKRQEGETLVFRQVVRSEPRHSIASLSATANPKAAPSLVLALASSALESRRKFSAPSVI